MPQYDALSDPALGKFWAKKFGWTIAAPAAGGYPGPSHSHSHSHGGGYGSGGGSGPMDYAVTLFTVSKLFYGKTGGAVTMRIRLVKASRLYWGFELAGWVWPAPFATPHVPPRFEHLHHAY